MASNVGRYQKLGEALVHKGFLAPADLEVALRSAPRVRKRLGEWLLGLGLAIEDEIVECLAEQFDTSVVDPFAHPPDPATLRLIDADFAARHLMLPIEIRGQRLTVVMSDPADVPVIDLISRLRGVRIEIRLAAPSVLREAIACWYREAGATTAAVRGRPSSRRIPRVAAAPPPPPRPRFRRRSL